MSEETKDPNALAIIKRFQWPGTKLAVDNRVLIMAQLFACWLGEQRHLQHIKENHRS